MLVNNKYIIDLLCILAMLQSMKPELDKQTHLKQEAENKLRETEQTLKNVQAKYKQLINGLQGQVEEHSTARVG